MNNEFNQINEHLKSWRLPTQRTEKRRRSARFCEKRAKQYNGFVDDLNDYLQNRYNFQTKPVTSISLDHCGPIDVNIGPVRLYLHFKPYHCQYSKYSISIGNASFYDYESNENLFSELRDIYELNETKAFLKFLLSQSEKCEFLGIHIQKYANFSRSLIKYYEFDNFEEHGGRPGWQIFCEDLKVSINKPLKHLNSQETAPE